MEEIQEASFPIPFSLTIEAAELVLSQRNNLPSDFERLPQKVDMVASQAVHVDLSSANVQGIVDVALDG